MKEIHQLDDRLNNLVMALERLHPVLPENVGRQLVLGVSQLYQRSVLLHSRFGGPEQEVLKAVEDDEDVQVDLLNGRN